VATCFNRQILSCEVTIFTLLRECKVTPDAAIKIFLPGPSLLKAISVAIG